MHLLGRSHASFEAELMETFKGLDSPDFLEHSHASFEAELMETFWQETIVVP